jgi:hypothetical protein
VGESLVEIIRHSHVEYLKLFGTSRKVTTTLKLMNSDDFYRTTKTPRWTNAMYYRGQVIIPIDEETMVDSENLVRSVRHEYLHAVIHAVSGGRCPGWLDEGLAQWAEGDENPALKPALRKWLAGNDPVPLALLQGGFTKLDTAMVPAAYSQSLYAAKRLIATFGFDRIRRYLEILGEDAGKAEAFIRGFGMTEEWFENELGRGLMKRFRPHT